MKNITTKTRKELLTLPKTFQLFFSPVTTNNRNIYNLIYDSLHKTDAVVFAFVDNNQEKLDFYCEAFKWFYDEPNIYFIGIEINRNNITKDLIDVAIDTIEKSNLPLNDYLLESAYKTTQEQILPTNTSMANDNSEDENIPWYLKACTGPVKHSLKIITVIKN